MIIALYVIAYLVAGVLASAFIRINMPSNPRYRPTAAAPDCDKLAAIAESLKLIRVPLMETKAGAASAYKVTAGIEDLIELIHSEYKALGK